MRREKPEFAFDATGGTGLAVRVLRITAEWNAGEEHPGAPILVANLKEDTSHGYPEILLISHS